MRDPQMRFPLKSLLILILTLNLCFLLVALTRLNFEAVPNVDIKVIGTENQRLIKEHTDILRENTKIFRDNSRKIDRIMEFIDREKANELGHKAKAQ